ncbi:MAG: hypothetical protein B6D68_00910 [spirochete symbiont of Stewartia floridana]|nr:MAG: hypothetical protein B6D68_00910 [spirochete symbiont of Stewartia floridana]
MGFLEVPISSKRPRREKLQMAFREPWHRSWEKVQEMAGGSIVRWDSLKPLMPVPLSESNKNAGQHIGAWRAR